MKLKRLWNEYIKAEEKANAADEAYEMEPENEELEKAFDEAYRAEYKAMEKVAAEMVTFTKGKIDHALACKMVRMQRAAIEDLINRVA